MLFGIGQERNLVINLSNNVQVAVTTTVLIAKKSDGKEKPIRVSNVREAKDGSITLASDDDKLIIRLCKDGDVEVNCLSENHRIVQVTFSVKGRRMFDRYFAHGYQTWNLSKSGKIGKDRRHKSVASKMGFSAMWHDTDGPAWKMKGHGDESHGLLILQLANEKKNFLLLGGSTCKTGTTSFWVDSSKSQFRIFLDFGRPGIETARERLRLRMGDSSVDLMQEYAMECKELQDKTIPLRSPLRERGHAPVGWGSWYEYMEHVTNQNMIEVLEVLKNDERLNTTIEVVQLDDGYQLNTGDWLETQPRFGEDDLSEVAKKIDAAGYVPGLWTAPFIASRTSKVFKEHPDWFLRRRSDPKSFVIGHFNPAWKRGCSFDSMVMHVLDLSNPEVLDHITNVFRELAKHWKLFKIDFLAAGMREGIRKNGDSVTRIQAYIDGLHAIRRGIGETSYLLGCGAPMLPSAQSGCLDAMRTSCDTAERWEAPLALRMVVGDWAIPCCMNACWGNMTRFFMHDTMWRFNDPDCLILRRKNNTMTEPQIKAQITCIGLTGGMCLLTDNLPTLEQDRLTMGTAIMPPSPSRGVPTSDMLEPGPPSGFAVGDVEDTSSAAVAAVFNWQNGTKQHTVQRNCFEFWTEKCYKKGEKCPIVSYGSVAAFQLAPQDSIVVGTTIHLTALVDNRIQVESPDSNTCVIKGTDVFARKQGALFFSDQVENLKVQSSSGIEILGDNNNIITKANGALKLDVRITSPEFEIVLTFDSYTL